MKNLLLVAALYFLCVTEAIADDVNETIAVLCDSSSEEMRIKAIFMNRGNMLDSHVDDIYVIPDGYELDRRSCEFLNSTEAKIELDEGVSSLRGQCSLNPPINLKITKATGDLLEFEFSPRCGGLLIESAVIHRDHIIVCKYVELSYKAPWVPDNIALEPEHECQMY